MLPAAIEPSPKKNLEFFGNPQINHLTKKTKVGFNMFLTIKTIYSWNMERNGVKMASTLHRFPHRFPLCHISGRPRNRLRGRLGRRDS
jgi:hypothetical protein